MGNDPVHDVGRGLSPPHFLETLDSARHARYFAWLLQIKFLDCGMNVLWGMGRHARG